MPHVPKDTLIATLTEMAQGHLRKMGGFHPFGMALDMDSEGRMVLAAMDDEPLDVEGQIRIILNVLRTEAAAGRLQAYAICADAELEDGNSEWMDAIKIMVEDPSTGMNVYLPYRRERSGLLKRLTYSYGEQVATPGERKVFG